jgi:hypothetical protein
MLFLFAGQSSLRAQPAPRTATIKPATPEELSPAELLESYRHVREQLHAAQLAIVNNRLEAEASARSQAAVLTEKLEVIEQTLAAERKRQQAELDRFDYERERQRLEAQRVNRLVVWIAAAFGLLGLAAMVFTALFQWRTINRMAEVMDLPQLPAPSGQGWLTGGPDTVPDQKVALSNQRLLSTIGRMEQRIVELEHMSANPFPAAAPTNPLSQTERGMA